MLVHTVAADAFGRDDYIDTGSGSAARRLCTSPARGSAWSERMPGVGTCQIEKLQNLGDLPATGFTDLRPVTRLDPIRVSARAMTGIGSTTFHPEASAP